MLLFCLVWQRFKVKFISPLLVYIILPPSLNLFCSGRVDWFSIVSPPSDGTDFFCKSQNSVEVFFQLVKAIIVWNKEGETSQLCQHLLFLSSTAGFSLHCYSVGLLAFFLRTDAISINLFSASPLHCCWQRLMVSRSTCQIWVQKLWPHQA